MSRFELRAVLQSQLDELAPGMTLRELMNDVEEEEEDVRKAFTKKTILSIFDARY